ncbi:MAG: Uma2 family endonuclease [Nitrospirae bacterium]|nr:Uma2 family endonuclease [Nitrospirota bacterium]MCL5285486.1 Uma2 family endonuclease [Nitrospirota bacterium]
MTTVKPQEWTYEDYLALPEGGPLRYEVIDGELYMTPAPNTRHQEISMNLSGIFWNFLRSNPIGKIFVAPYDVIFSHSPLQYVEPDLVFVSKERSSIVTEQNIQGVPDLVVEILSDGTGIRDRRKKFSLYERFGVLEYWIVDPEEETVQIFRLSDGIYQAPVEIRKGAEISSPLLPGLSIATNEIFPS